MVSAAAENNLISGYPDGTFRPQKSITQMCIRDSI